MSDFTFIVCLILGGVIFLVLAPIILDILALVFNAVGSLIIGGI